MLFLVSPIYSQRRNKPSEFKKDNVGKIELISPTQFQYNGKDIEYIGKVYFASESSRLKVGDAYLTFTNSSKKRGAQCNQYSIDIIPYSNYKSLIKERLKSKGEIEICQLLGKKYVKLYDKTKNEQLVLEAADYDFNQLTGTLDAKVIIVLDVK